jgi:hypothetical protein
MYSTFLLILSQLTGQKRARVVVQDKVVFVDVSTSKGKECWTLSTQVYQGEGEIPSSVHSYVSGTDLLRWQQKGAHLKIEPRSNSVLLVEEIQMPGQKYIFFRAHFEKFLQSVAEWKEIFVESNVK